MKTQTRSGRAFASWGAMVGLATSFGCSSEGDAIAGNSVQQDPTAEEEANDPSDVAEAAETRVAELERQAVAHLDVLRMEMPPEARDADRQAAMQAHEGALSVSWNARGTVRSLRGWRMRLPVPVSGDATPEHVAAAFLADNAALFGLSDPAAAFRERRIRPAKLGAYSVVRADQAMNGLPVFKASIVLHVGEENDVQFFGGHVVPDFAMPAEGAEFTEEQALAVVEGAREATLGYWDPTLFDAQGDVRVAWRLRTEHAEEIYIDAQTGAELSRASLSDADDAGAYSEHKEVFACPTCSAWSDLPGTLHHDDECHASGVNMCLPGLGCDDGVPPCQTSSPPTAVADAIAHADDVHDYYYDHFGRKGWYDEQCGTPSHPCTDPDRNRMRVISQSDARYSCRAGYNSFQGFDPDYAGSIEFPSNRTCLNLIAHEATHGVNESEGDLGGTTTQSDTAEEAYMDAMAEFVEIGAVGSADWGFAMDCDCGRAHSWANPASGFQVCTAAGFVFPPTNWSEYRPEDCNINWNSYILSNIAYLMGREPSAGSIDHWGISVTGIGADLAEDVWYHALTETTWADETLTEAAYGLLSGCENATPPNSPEFLNCYLAIASAGFWSYDYPQSWTTLNSVSVAKYHVNGSPRIYIFTKTPSGQLDYRYRTCNISDASCSWSSPVTVATNAATAPDAAVYNAWLWFCYKTSDTGLMACSRIGPDGTVSAAPTPYTGLDDAPAIANNNGSLVTVYKRGGVTYWRKFVAYFWGAEQAISGLAAAETPSLASGNEDLVSPSNDLLVVYRRASDNRIAYRALDHGTSTWGAEALAGHAQQTPTTTWRPMSAMHRGRVHIAAQDASNGIYTMSAPRPCPGVGCAWTRFVKQDGDTGPYAFSLDSWGARDGYLYLWHTTSTSNTLNWRAKLSE